MDRDTAFRRDLESLVNRHSRENGSDTPDFVLAEYLGDCLAAFDKSVQRRSGWYGRHDKPGANPGDPLSPTEVVQPTTDTRTTMSRIIEFTVERTATDFVARTPYRDIVWIGSSERDAIRAMLSGLADLQASGAINLLVPYESGHSGGAAAPVDANQTEAAAPVRDRTPRVAGLNIATSEKSRERNNSASHGAMTGPDRDDGRGCDSTLPEREDPVAIHALAERLFACFYDPFANAKGNPRKFAGLQHFEARAWENVARNCARKTLELLAVQHPARDACSACNEALRQALETQRRLLSERQALERQLRAAGRVMVELQRVLGMTAGEFCEEEVRA